MNSIRPVAAILIWMMPLVGNPQNSETPLKSHAELTNYEETSRYEDVLRFFNDLQQRTSLMRLQNFGLSGKGRPLPLAILSDPAIALSREARDSGKPIVFVLANIHAGEVEGKEAVQHLAGRLVEGDLHPLRSEEHTSELQSHSFISYAVFC